MAVEKSSLTEKHIMELLKTRYNIDGNTTIIKLSRGSANLFKVETENNTYILKEFNSDKTLETINKEVKIINFLQSKGFSVPNCIPLSNGKYYSIYNEKIIILQQYIEGYTIENNTGDYKKTIESAMILGRLTKEMKEYEGLSEEGIIEKWFSRESTQNAIKKLEEEKTRIRDDNEHKQQFIKDFTDKILIAGELLGTFDFRIIRKMSIMNTHGDYSLQQLIYSKNHPTSVIDFETAKKMPIVWEIMRSYSYIDEKAKGGNIDINNLIEYFKEFSKYVELNEYDLRYAPHIYLIQLIGSTFGYREYNRDYNQNDLLRFALFRTNLCRSLYNNLEQINKSLLKHVPHKQLELEER